MKQLEQARIFLMKAKQDEDLIDAVILLPAITDEIIGFHCQQVAEKLFKAYLSVLGVNFQRTHNLRNLMDLLSDAGHALPAELTELDRLTPFGTVMRYEEPDPDLKLDRAATRKELRQLRKWVESGVGAAKNG